MKRTPHFIVAAAFGTFLIAGTTLGQHTHDHTRDVFQPPAQPPVAVGNPNPEGPHPRLVFSKTEHDFGRISDEGMVEARFEFKNEGTDVLRFTIPFRATCGCTAGNPRSESNPDVDQVEFQPGESGFIKMSFNAHGKQGDQPQQVTVTSNDPVHPEQVLKVKAFVRQTLAIDPPLVSFGEVMAGQPATQIVKVRGPAPDFSVTYASVTKPRFFRAKVLETREVEMHGEKLMESTIQLTFTGNAPRGSQSAMATARTTSPKHALKDIQISAEVVGDVQVLPPRLNLGGLDPSQPFNRIFRVSSRTGKTFKITKIDQTTSMEPLEINISPVEAGNESAYQVEVKGKATSHSGPLLATLSILTDVPGDERIQVQLSGAVRNPSPPDVPTDHTARETP
jgi:hypothetical protein